MGNASEPHEEHDDAIGPDGAREAATTTGLPVSVSLGPTLEAAAVRRHETLVDRRVVFVTALAIALAAVTAVVAQVLTRLITLVTNLSFFGRLSFAPASPADNALGLAVVVVPVVGGIVVGLMARYGSKAIRGHGIPEAMEQVLTNESRIPPRITFLKPVSAAISIGTGGPFGAEGPIIATGGALGSLVGQILHTRAAERKTLLASGAAAGMAATFGSPLSAVLLAVELLLFEYRARSLVPVVLAATVGAAVHATVTGGAPVFPMPLVAAPSLGGLATYVGLGVVAGGAATLVTRAVYGIEDAFEKLPIHWMWWPALGGIAVGVVGFFEPRVLGVGYDNIEHVLAGDLALRAVIALCTLKLVAWSISLGSGTSGGTLAPLLTIGAGLGYGVTTVLASVVPSVGLDPRLGALVGMAALFAGASRAVLASLVFAFEVTRQPAALLPLLGGCGAAYLVSCLTMRNSIMTEKLGRRGVQAHGEYSIDRLEQITVGSVVRAAPVVLRADDPVADVQAFLRSGEPGSDHQGYPVVDADGALVGVVTRRDLRAVAASSDALRTLVRRSPIVITAGASLREAADRMAAAGIGRLPVVAASDPRRVVGVLTRSDLVRAQGPRPTAGVAR